MASMSKFANAFSTASLGNLTITRAHHVVQIALECRDHSRPVTVGMVEAFHQKCQDTGVHNSSTSGFWKTARQKAAHYGIRCLDVLEAQSFAWMLTPSFTFLTRRTDSQSWLFFPEQEGVRSQTLVSVQGGRPIKKGRYVYYHCTGYKGKCPEPYVRQEVLEERFSEQMDRLSFDADFLEWVREALYESHSDELREHEAAIARHQTEYDRLQDLTSRYVRGQAGRTR